MNETRIRIRKKPVVCFSEEFSRDFCPSGLNAGGDQSHGKAFFVLDAQCVEIMDGEASFIRFKGNGSHRNLFVKEVLGILQEV